MIYQHGIWVLSMCLSVGFSVSSYAKQSEGLFGIPSLRFSGERHEDAADRSVAEFKQKIVTSPGQRVDDYFGADPDSSAYALATLRKNLDVSGLTQWDNQTQVEHAFTSARDSRFLILSFDGSQERRRISWMLPQDGCFVRAEVAKNRLQKFGYPDVKKIFAFGDLSAATPHTESGSADWWFHVAVAVAVGDQIMVLDPAVEAARPISLDAWAKLISPEPDKVTFSLCDADTFGPFNRCDEPKIFSSFLIDFLQGILLRLEQANMVVLGRDPVQELVEYPYWRTHPTAGALPFLQTVQYYDEFDTTQKLGHVFANYNAALGQIEYFERVGSAEDLPLPLPSDSSSNASWHYLGPDYPIQFDVNQAIGLVVPRFHFFTGRTDYFRLLQRGLLGFSYPMPFEPKDTRHWEYVHSKR